MNLKNSYTEAGGSGSSLPGALSPRTVCQEECYRKPRFSLHYCRNQACFRKRLCAKMQKSSRFTKEVDLDDFVEGFDNSSCHSLCNFRNWKTKHHCTGTLTMWMQQLFSALCRPFVGKGQFDCASKVAKTTGITGGADKAKFKFVGSP